MSTFANPANYGELSYITLSAKWQKLALAYNLRIGQTSRQGNNQSNGGSSENIQSMAMSLFKSLKKKDLRIRNSEAYDPEDEDYEKFMVKKVFDHLDNLDRDLFYKTEESVHNIKMMVIVALIYEITRN